MPAKAQLLKNYWRVIEPMIASATPVAIGRYLPIDVLEMVDKGTVQGWLVVETTKLTFTILAVIVTQIVNYPRRKGLLIFLCAGKEMHRWFDLARNELLRFAKGNGCDHWELEGRKGWSRRMNMKERAIVMTEEFESMNKKGGDEITSLSTGKGGSDV